MKKFVIGFTDLRLYSDRSQPGIEELMAIRNKQYNVTRENRRKLFKYFESRAQLIFNILIF